MSRRLDGSAVHARLERLRALCVPMLREEALDMHAVQGSRAEGFPAGVERRLAELRALCELTRYLHAARKRLGAKDRSDRPG